MSITVTVPARSGNPASALAAECAPYPAFIIQDAAGGCFQVVPAGPDSDGRPVAAGLGWGAALVLRQRLNAEAVVS